MKSEISVNLIIINNIFLLDFFSFFITLVIGDCIPKRKKKKEKWEGLTELLYFFQKRSQNCFFFFFLKGLLKHINIKKKPQINQKNIYLKETEISKKRSTRKNKKEEERRRRKKIWFFFQSFMKMFGFLGFCFTFLILFSFWKLPSSSFFFHESLFEIFFLKFFNF